LPAELRCPSGPRRPCRSRRGPPGASPARSEERAGLGAAPPPTDLGPASHPGTRPPGGRSQPDFTAPTPPLRHTTGKRATRTVRSALLEANVEAVLEGITDEAEGGDGDHDDRERRIDLPPVAVCPSLPLSAASPPTRGARPSERREGPRKSGGPLNEYPGGVLLSQGDSPQVPSALVGLTSVFGMGTGVSPPPWPPENLGSARTAGPADDLTALEPFIASTNIEPKPSTD